MTSDIFKGWFKTCFIPEAHNHCRKSGLPDNCKIILLLDNCSAHAASEVHIQDTFVHYLPSNCNVLFNLWMRGFYNPSNASIKRNFLYKILDACSSEDSISAFQKEFTIEDALWRIISVWENIPKEILSNNWHKIYPTLIYIEDDARPKIQWVFGIGKKKEKKKYDQRTGQLCKRYHSFPESNF